jgi:hypothetical protein
VQGIEREVRAAPSFGSPPRITNARSRTPAALASSGRAIRAPTRYLFERAWNPVGSGVKSDDEVHRMVDAVLLGEAIDRIMGDIQRRISALPGVAGIDAPARRCRASVATPRRPTRPSSLG